MKQSMLYRLGRFVDAHIPIVSNQSSNGDEKKAVEKKVVARFSRGNTRLQQGEYLTQDDIDARFKRIRERIVLNND